MKFFAFLLALPLFACAAPPVLNDAVTQATIGKTICVPNWTAQVRPSTTYTDWVKAQKMAAAKLDPSTADQYELDHVMPLALGGHPHAMSNLRLQPWAGPAGAKAKDKVETRLHREVCTGKRTLADAQSCIQHWRTCR